MGAEPQGTLVVEVGGLHSDKGQVLCRLFHGEAGFPTDGARALRQVRERISGGKARIEIAGIPFGSYALACVHDENGNGKLDTNWVGAPKEGIGASNDARGHRGPPASTRIAIRY